MPFACSTRVVDAHSVDLTALCNRNAPLCCYGRIVTHASPFACSTSADRAHSVDIRSQLCARRATAMPWILSPASDSDRHPRDKTCSLTAIVNGIVSCGVGTHRLCAFTVSIFDYVIRCRQTQHLRDRPLNSKCTQTRSVSTDDLRDTISEDLRPESNRLVL